MAKKLQVAGEGSGQAATGKAPRASSADDQRNQLYNGDNLIILREYVKDESVDLIYLDPPFNSGKDYNMIYKAEAQERAFSDTWHWNDPNGEAPAAYHEVQQTGRPAAFVLEAIKKALGEGEILAYASMMTIRLFELHRVLKSNGSLYLHCDPTASHYLKVLLDSIFGSGNFRNEVIWKRTGAHGASQKYAPLHDVLLFYTKGDSFVWTDPRGDVDQRYVDEKFNEIDQKTGRRFQAISLTGAGTRTGESGLPWRGFNPTEKGRHWAIPRAVAAEIGIITGTVQERLDRLDDAGMIYWPAKKGGQPRLKWFADRLQGTALSDIWTDIAPVNSQAQERIGYPTQKPMALMRRIIEASSNEGDVVLDPFCGCGTTIETCEELHRKWIGIDVASKAIRIIRERIEKHGEIAAKSYREIDDPSDFESAVQLAATDKFAFEQWAVGLLGGAIPNKKKGSDKGIDGRITFREGESKNSPVKQILLSVKGGGTGPKDVRDLLGVVEGEGAAIGVLITLHEPTGPMRQAATKAGMYTTTGTAVAERYPRIQILAVAELLRGAKIRAPSSVPQKPPRRSASPQLGFMFALPGGK